MLKQTIFHFRAYCLIAAVALITGCAAGSLKGGPPSLQTQVQSAINQGRVSVSLEGTTATLTGHVKDTVDRNRAISAANGYEGVDRVVNRIFVFDN